MRISIMLALLTASTLLGGQGLVINEFVASNDSTSMISDEFGEFDDWVEFYNNTSEAIDMGGYYFSDDATELNKWQFPAGIAIPANGYLILWTDSDNGQGDLHTNFKLSKLGEQVILSDNSLVVLDSLTFGEQETNVSTARIPNGTGDFTFRAPTHGFNNDEGGVFVNNILVREDFDVIPNPAYHSIQVDFSQTKDFINTNRVTVLISDISGKLLFSKEMNAVNAVLTLDINQLNAGLHFLHIQTDTDLFMKKFIVSQHD